MGNGTIVTTPRLALEPPNEAGLREEGRSLWPAKWLEALLIPEQGATKLVDREVLTEVEELVALIGVTVRDEDGNAIIGLLSAKLEAAVATSMVSEPLRERRKKWKFKGVAAFKWMSLG